VANQTVYFYVAIDIAQGLTVRDLFLVSLYLIKNGSIYYIYDTENLHPLESFGGVNFVPTYPAYEHTISTTPVLSVFSLDATACNSYGATDCLLQIHTGDESVAIFGRAKFSVTYETVNKKRSFGVTTTTLSSRFTISPRINPTTPPTPSVNPTSSVSPTDSGKLSTSALGAVVAITSIGGLFVILAGLFIAAKTMRGRNTR
jgi:hypothetical protein